MICEFGWVQCSCEDIDVMRLQDDEGPKQLNHGGEQAGKEQSNASDSLGNYPLVGLVSQNMSNVNSVHGEDIHDKTSLRRAFTFPSL